ncbi:MAG: hypothetical protein PUB97_02510 [Ruminococcus sp.]|nr:hypothetical protein [Ruminococcus sp.]
MKFTKEELIDLGITFAGLVFGSMISDALGLGFWLHVIVSLTIICAMNLVWKAFDRKKVSKTVNNALQEKYDSNNIKEYSDGN